jgi:CBS domain-containing protein/ribosome-associated translation inhibitor RaiA
MASIYKTYPKVVLEVPSIGPEENASAALARMREMRVYDLAVEKNGKFMGLVSYKSLLGRPIQTKVRSFLETPPSIHGKKNLVDLAETFLTVQSKMIPVLAGEKELKGAIDEASIIEAMLGCDEIKGISIREIMNSSPYSISQKESVARALSIIKKHDVRRLPVVDGDSEKVLGLLDILDLGETAIPMESQPSGDLRGEQEKYIKHLKVDGFMGKAMKVHETKTLDAVLPKMVDNRVVCVVDGDDRLIGIVTNRDLLEWLASLRKGHYVYLQMVGLDQVSDSFDKDLIESTMTDAIKGRLGEMLKGDIERVIVHIKAFEKEGMRARYAIKVRLNSKRRGVFMTRETGWDPTDAMNKAIDELERQVVEQKERRLDRMRGKL